MNRLLIALAASTLTLISGAALAAVQGKEISYSADGVTMKGYLAWDDALQGKRPGVLVVHEWWGHNDYARKRARMLAEQGYTALAVDMYGDGKKAKHPKEAGAFMNAVFDQADRGRARFEAAMATLKAEPSVNAGELGALGYCFGGAVVLNMARNSLDLKGVASFHGALGTPKPAVAGAVKAKIRVFTGGADGMIPPAQVDAFKAEMDKAGADYQVVVYPGVKHSFTNPEADALAQKFSMPIGYDAAADKDSWEQVMAFFKATFATKK